MKWVRARDGALFGVAKGLAQTLGIPVGLFRFLWLVSLLFFGAGLWLYLMLALSLPREDKVQQAMEPWVLGVCTNISRRTEVEVGIIRFLAICLAVISLGATLVGYFILYFVLDKPQTTHQSSDNKPFTPPPTK